MKRPAKSRKKRAQRYHHGDLRAALVDASSKLVQSEGVDALSLRAVARRLGVSHAAPSHHFADKRALLRALAARGFDELTAQTSRAASRATSARARLEATGVAYVRFAAEHPEHFRLMFGRELAKDDDDDLARASTAAYQVLVDAVSAVLAESPGIGESAEVVTTAAWSVVHGLAMLYLDDRMSRERPLSVDELAMLAARVTKLVSRAVA